MYISIKDVKDFLFCPLRFYYNYYLNLGFPKMYWDELGKEIECSKKEKIKEKLSKNYLIIEIKEPIKSETYKLQGIPDLVLKHKKYNFYAVCEIKNSKKLKREFLYSLASYGLLLEDNDYYPIKKLIIYLVKVNKIIEVEFTETLKNRTKNIIKMIHKVINGELKPYPKLDRCNMCDFINYCKEKENESV